MEFEKQFFQMPNSSPTPTGPIGIAKVTQLDQFNSVASMDYIAQPKVIAAALLDLFG